MAAAVLRANLPVLVIRVTVGQETGDRLGHFLAGEDVPQTIGPQHQNVVGPVFVLRERVHFDLEVMEGEIRLEREKI